MKALIASLAVVVSAAGVSLPAAAASWGYPAFGFDVQAQKGRNGPDRGQPPRELRPDRQQQPDRGERRERLNDDERRALHRDLDKANRELYQRRQK